MIQTCYMKRGISARRDPGTVASHTGVHRFMGLTLSARDDAEEEQTSFWQNDRLWLRIHLFRVKRLAISEPLDGGLRVALRPAGQSGRTAHPDNHIWGMVDDTGEAAVWNRPGTWRTEKEESTNSDFH